MSAPLSVTSSWTLIQAGPYSGRMTDINSNGMYVIAASSLPSESTTGVKVDGNIPFSVQAGFNLYAKTYSGIAMARVDSEFVMVASPPLSLLTDSGGISQRLRVDPDQTSFWQGKQYRSFMELNISSGATQVIKNAVAVNTILYGLSVLLDSGSVRLSIVSGGTEGGSFSTTLPAIRKNTMTDAPNIPAANISTTGGTLTGGSVIGIERIVTANATAQRSTVGSSPFDQRGVAPGSYYWKLENIGTGEATGTISFFWEER